MVYDESLLETIRTALIVTIKIAGPILLAGVVIGLIISIFQSVTSIQDQSLTFVPKILVMILAAILLIPWIVERLLAFTREMFLLNHF
ncbi:MAG: flagellar biosynthetic protein FliQ [Phycisphaerales bacterium]